MIWAATKRQIQRVAGAAGYRIVPRARDAHSLRHWLFKQPINTVIDVGASRGETSEEWLDRFPSATVHAIEPLPSSFAVLESVRARNASRMRTYNYAVGREQGKVSFRVHPLHHTSSSLLAPTELSARLLPESKKETIIDVTLTTLDDLFAESMASMKGEVLLKLDVQGVESDVIAGASRFLKHVKYFLTEIGLAPVYVGQSDFNTVHMGLTAAGFAVKGFLEQFHVEDLTPIYADVLYVNEVI